MSEAVIARRGGGPNNKVVRCGVGVIPKTGGLDLSNVSILLGSYDQEINIILPQQGMVFTAEGSTSGWRVSMKKLNEGDSILTSRNCYAVWHIGADGKPYVTIIGAYDPQQDEVPIGYNK